MSAAIVTGQSKTRLRAFVLGSVILHGVALAGWQASAWMTGQANSVLSVTLSSDRAVAASTEARLMTPSTRKIVPRTNNVGDETPPGKPGAINRIALGTALMVAPTEVKLTSLASRTGDSRPTVEMISPADDVKQDNTQNASNSTSSSALAVGEDDKRRRATAQIRAQLNTDLARYFDYPYVARLRGWEGTVLLAFDIETDGRLKGIRVAQSSGYAVLDDSAVTALRKVERLTEATAWLREHDLAMQIPVVYRLRGPDTNGRGGNRIAATDLENR